MSWNSKDAAALSAFLAGSAGQNFIETLTASLPDIDDVQTIEHAALRGKEKQGGENVIRKIKSMVSPNELQSDPSPGFQDL